MLQPIVVFEEAVRTRTTSHDPVAHFQGPIAGVANIVIIIILIIIIIIIIPPSPT